MSYNNREWLNEQYTIQGKLGREIAEECTVSEPAIYYWLKKFNIKRRTNTETRMGINNPNWKGGKIKHHGYVRILRPNHPRANRDGYVLEHIIIMEELLNRFIKIKEKVHHINGIRDDNRLENLYLCKDKSEHQKIEHSLSNCLPELIENRYLIFNKKKKIYEVI